MGHIICGENGEDGDYKGVRYLLSNRKTLGTSETEALKEFNEFVQDIIKSEMTARRKILADFPHRILNHVNRAFGLLKSSWVLSEDEAYDNLMILRSGVMMGMFEHLTIESINNLMLSAGDAHLQNALERNLMPEELDIARAKFFKTKLS
jgi:protein arginine kinase